MMERVKTLIDTAGNEGGNVHNPIRKELAYKWQGTKRRSEAERLRAMADEYRNEQMDKLFHGE